MKKSLLILAFAGTMALSQSAFALTVYDPTNHTENLATKLNTVEMLQKQALQIQHELSNLAKLDPAMSNETTAKIRNNLNQLNEIRNSINAIGTDYEKLMNGFDDIFPDYEDWNGCSAEQYAKQVDKINDAWDEAVKQAMGSASNASPEEQAATMEQLSNLLSASQNAEGAMGALQASNQLTALTVAQLKKMETMMADSMRTQNMYYEKQIAAERAAKKRKEEFYKNNEKYKDIRIEAGNSKLGHFKGGNE